MIPHYAFYLPDGCLSSLSFTNGGETTSLEFPTGVFPGQPLYKSHLPGARFSFYCGELAHFAEIPFSEFRLLPAQDRPEALSALVENCFLKVFKDLELAFEDLAGAHQKKFGRVPVAGATLWRTEPTALSADDPRKGAIGYLVCGVLAMTVSSVLPDEVGSTSPTPLPSYKRPEALIGGDYRTDRDRVALALHATSGVRW